MILSKTSRKKKLLFRTIAFFLMFLTIVPLVSCDIGGDKTGESNMNSDEISSESETSRELIPSERAAEVWNNEWMDKVGGFSDASTIYGFDFYKNRKRTDDDASDLADEDYKYIFFGEDNSRIVNISDGYALTLPDVAFETDYTLSGYRSRYKTDEYLLTVSSENKNPYLKGGKGYEEGWEIYLTEWLNRFVDNPSFLSANSIRRSKKKTESTEVIDGYTVLIYNLEFIFPKKFEYSNYDIAIIRENDEFVQFYLLVMKSKSRDTDRFEEIVKSFKEFEKTGTSANPEEAYELKVPEYWNDETKAYFEKLQNQSTVDWGFFVGGLAEDKSANYNKDYKRVTETSAMLTDAMNYTPDIRPTYLHIGWGDNLTSFPDKMAPELAGGNGFNGKPVLQMSYQFTTLNNTNLDGYTPMFDILKGDYDNHFRNIARSIKDYGKPVLFRLNNEMNSDWVSYCGMITLLDPDIFIDTWQRMYDIFVEEGVDNCIWIFHPIRKTTPYSNWGEWLCYMPGADYVQMFGAGDYDMNNNNSPISFKTINTENYNKVMPYFDKYPWIISEFACGAGGEVINQGGKFVPVELGRYQNTQAMWVKSMFNILNDLDNPNNEYAKRIKAAVWFSTNDYVSVDGVSKITNYLALDKELTKTLDAFKEGYEAGRNKDK